jgi:hypothetical protein
VARGRNVPEVLTPTDLFGPRVKAETYNAPQAPQHCKRCQRFGHMHRNCGYASRYVDCGVVQTSGKCVTPKQQLR